MVSLVSYQVRENGYRYKAFGKTTLGHHRNQLAQPFLYNFRVFHLIRFGPERGQKFVLKSYQCAISPNTKFLVTFN